MSEECPHHDDINPIELDRDGGHYVYWVERLTRDDLHSKADIAQCLGWQRREIERLRAFVAAFDEWDNDWRAGQGESWRFYSAMLAARKAFGPCS